MLFLRLLLLLLPCLFAVAAFTRPISNAAAAHDGSSSVAGGEEAAQPSAPAWRDLTTEQRLLVAVDALALSWAATRGWGRDVANRLRATHKLPPYLKAVFKTLSAKQKRSYFSCFLLETAMRKDEAYWTLVDWRPTIRQLCMARVAPKLFYQAQEPARRDQAQAQAPARRGRTPGIERPAEQSERQQGAQEREGGSERKSMAESIDLGALLKESLQRRYPMPAAGFLAAAARPTTPFVMAPFARVPR